MRSTTFPSLITILPASFAIYVYHQTDDLARLAEKGCILRLNPRDLTRRERDISRHTHLGSALPSLDGNPRGKTKGNSVRAVRLTY